MSGATVKNAVDTFVSQGALSKNYNTKSRVWVGNVASNIKNTWLYFNRPFPIGVNIISAHLRMYTATAFGGSHTITARLAAAKWNINKINYNNAPGVGAGTSATVVTGVAAGTLIDIDVTTLMQTISAGGQGWYGFRITDNSASNNAIHSAQSDNGSMRPVLVIVWSDAPNEPDSLRPSNGRFVPMPSILHTWSFSDLSGDQNLAGVEVQYGSSQVLLDAGSIQWGSGFIPSSEPQLDTRVLVNSLTDPGFEVGITGWTATNATLAQSATQAHTGTQSLRVTSTSAVTAPVVESPKMPIVAGQSAVASFWLRAATTTRTWTHRIRFYDAVGVFVSDGAVSNMVSESNAAWNTAQTTAAVAPPTATQYTLYFTPSTAIASGEQHYLDDIILQFGSLSIFSPLTVGSSVWWRCRNMDGAGLWSPWADSVQAGYQPYGNISSLQVSGSTTGIQEASPTVTWAFSGVQSAYQVIIADAADPTNWLWDTGKVQGGQQSVGIPFGTINDATLSYIITVRVWDNIAFREGIPGFPTYVEASTAALPFAYSGAVTNPTSLAMTSDLVRPIATLTWVSAVAPDTFQIQRSDDGGLTWYYVDDRLPADLSTGGTNYAWVDTGAKQYVSHQWRVFRVVAGVQGTGAVVSGVVARLCPVLMRNNGNDACFFMNPERDRHRLGIQGLAERMGGPPVLVTQRLGGQTGHVRGRFVNEAPGGTYSARSQRTSFLALERDSGKKMQLAIANETLTVVAFNFNIDVLTDVQGITYLAEFDWIEVPS